MAAVGGGFSGILSWFFAGQGDISGKELTRTTA